LSLRCIVVGVEDERWSVALERVRHDIFSTAAYHRACDPSSGGVPFALVAEGHGQSFVHPFVRHSVEGGEGLASLESVYGYSGPVSTTDDRDFVNEVWAWFAEWCREQGVVAEFIRFDPLLGNESLAQPGATVERVRTSVLVSLEGGEEAIWSRYEGRQRTAARKARREGTEVTVVPAREGLADFLPLYRATMNRLRATPDYYFDDRYFEGVAALPGALAAVARDGGGAVASALVLAVDALSVAHYHLAAGNDRGRATGAGNLLVHEIALWAAQNGLTSLHLGGGRGGGARDELLRFKEAIGRESRDVFVGKVIHEEAAYARLRAQWESQHGPTPYFLFHRTPAVTTDPVTA
jgi:hypothetical protein